MRTATAFAIDAGRHERRRHQRVKVRLTGQFMRQDRREFPCATIDISPGGIAFEAEASGEVGERIIAYLNQIGRVEGTVARHFYGGFAIQMKLPPLKREKLADQLTWLANRQVLGMPEDRRHERIVPRNRHTTLTLRAISPREGAGPSSGIPEFARGPHLPRRGHLFLAVNG